MTFRESVISVRCFGNPTVEIHGVPVSSWRSTKAATLFYYLLDRRDRIVERATLIDALWPHENALAPEVSLKVAIHDLRRIITNVFGPSSELTIETRSSGYLLRANDVWHDVAEFERTITEAGRLDARDSRAEALKRYRRAVRLYQGDFLVGVTGDWILRRRQALLDQYLLGVTLLAEGELAAGDYRSCISHCLAALDKDAFRERSYQLLMLCHAQLGQFGRVRAWHNLCEQTLHTTLGIRPSIETERLLQHYGGRELNGQERRRVAGGAG
jgi:DNA-binding SARP family transcriptional activator